MKKTISVSLTSLFVTAFLFNAVALADFSRPVSAAFRGIFIVSSSDLPQGKNDKDTIAKIKATRLIEIVGGRGADNAMQWHFQYTAFLTALPSRTLTLLFSPQNGRGRRTTKTLAGVDTTAFVLSGEVSISAEEGIVPGTTYTVDLVSPANGKVPERKLASTSLKFR